MVVAIIDEPCFFTTSVDVSFFFTILGEVGLSRADRRRGPPGPSSSPCS